VDAFEAMGIACARRDETMNRFDGMRPQDGPIERPLTRCPDCGGELRAVADAAREGVEFWCEICDVCWHVELGYAHRVS
jgi:uncharacterized protein with PIN domain